MESKQTDIGKQISNICKTNLVADGEDKWLLDCCCCFSWHSEPISMPSDLKFFFVKMCEIQYL